MDPPLPDPPDPPDLSSSSSTDSVVIASGQKRRLDYQGNLNFTAKKTIIDSEMAAASIQNLYIHPNLVVGIKQYLPTDKGPFMVHVSRSEPDSSAGTSIRPIKFGQFLVNNKIRNICPDGVKKVGRNKISVEFKTAADANRFLDNAILSTNKYIVTIPTFNITKMGVVRQVPVDMSMDEFLESLVVPNGCGVVLKLRRLNRKTIEEGKPRWIPTQTVVITFQGQTLPDRIYSFHTSLPVETYQFPTIICQNCCRYGHVKSQCRSNPRCYRCAQPHTGDSCDVVETKASCLHCSGQHFANSRGCPEQGRQKSIKLMMSQESISYEEAARQHPKVIRPYSEVSRSSPLTQSSQSSHLSPSSSYRKTIYYPPRPRAPLDKSYDKAAHHKIVADEPSVLPNGYALSQNSLSLSQNDNLLEILLSMIINIISHNSTPIPSHVAQKLSEIISSNNHGRSTVERKKPASQEI